MWFRKGKNLFNKNVPIITGYYLNNNGILVPNEGSWYQNVFIEVNSKTQYTISSTVAILRICFYDKDRKFISRVATENTSITFSTPENCKYVRLSGQNADTQVQSLQLEQGSKATSYEAYIEPQIFIKNSNDVYEEFITNNVISGQVTDTTDNAGRILVPIPLGAIGANVISVEGNYFTFLRPLQSNKTNSLCYLKDTDNMKAIANTSVTVVWSYIK